MQPQPELNVALLWRVLDVIGRHPQRWDQRYWVNHTRHGTTYDIAGWAWVVHKGYSFRDNDPDLLALPSLARQLLGLNADQAARLFYWVSVGETPSRYRPWTWGRARHPTFQELVRQVERVTGYRFDPDNPVPEP